MSVDVVVKRNDIPRVRGNVSRATEKVRRQMIRFIIDRAQGYAPVDTGYLKEHIVETDFGVHAQAPYEAHQEFGTAHMGGTPHLRPAIRDAKANPQFDGFEAELLS